VPQADEDALVAKSRGGDRAAFEELVRRTARLVFARAYLETGDAHRAEDVAQETFLTAWRSIGQVTDPGGLRPWLLSILHSVVVDAARRANRKKRGRGYSRDDATTLLRLTDDRTPPPSELVARKDERQRALSVLRSLPAEYREPLMLRYIAGADYETIGRQLALTNGSLRGLLSRGMAMLREEINRKKR
jgi:RNA polymerase sigma factor (sigma-70 family)